MAPEHRDWAVPAPVRALLWWPPLAFVLVIIAPQAAAESVALAGAVLAVLGVGISAGARWLQRRPAPESMFTPLDRVDELAGQPVEQRAA
jgi:hypothetical protein